MKTGNYLTRYRNLFTETCFSESCNRFLESWGNARLQPKSHETGKSVGGTYGQSIIPAKENAIYEKQIFHDTAKQIRH
ncbi:hypothetical protein B5E82_15180 [Lachnoclostridium sp. An138]|nr:hypothetical protein B5E82_15180 [Lachnoclostridium sp. An138]